MKKLLNLFKKKPNSKDMDHKELLEFELARIEELKKTRFLTPDELDTLYDEASVRIGRKFLEEFESNKRNK